MVRLKKNIKWLVEDDSAILISHSKSTDFFEFPIDCLEAMEKLEEGTEPHFIDELLLDELRYIGLIDETVCGCCAG